MSTSEKHVDFDIYELYVRQILYSYISEIINLSSFYANNNGVISSSSTLIFDAQIFLLNQKPIKDI